MAQIIGEQAWTLRPGGSENYREDGSVEITRLYNGALSLFDDWRESMPPGTHDPEYGDASLSIAFPSLTERRNLTGVASITFSGGNFEDGETTTTPQVSKRIVTKVVEIPHAIFGTQFEITYFAWETTVSYSSTSEPARAGIQSSKADTTAIDLSTILQRVPDTYREMTQAEIDTATTPTDPILEGMEINGRGADDGGKIYDVIETWVMKLESA